MNDKITALRIEPPDKGDKLVIYGQGTDADGRLSMLKVKLYSFDLETLAIPSGTLQLLVTVEDSDE